MTETVKLALQGRVVQLGSDPNHLLLFGPAGIDPSFRLRQLGRTSDAYVELDADRIADLRDILNALAEREKQAEAPHIPGCRRLLVIDTCHSCLHYTKTLGACAHLSLYGDKRFSLGWRGVIVSRGIPDWCPLPQAEAGP